MTANQCFYIGGLSEIFWAYSYSSIFSFFQLSYEYDPFFVNLNSKIHYVLDQKKLDSSSIDHLEKTNQSLLNGKEGMKYQFIQTILFILPIKD